MNPLRTVQELGQSIWYDNLSKEILKSDELRKMIEEDGVTGVTSNPTIFQKALSNERFYDNDLHSLVDTGLDAQGIYEGLVIEDIREAADLLAPVYERTQGTDGFVSLEVPPALAYDRAGTVCQAQRLFALVDRKNLMIKVPGTHEGREATRELIASGVNVNVTLIFYLEQYECAISAYLAGIDQWIASGGDPKKVASVASFFVSRLDTAVDERIKESSDPAIRAAAPALLGKAAIANARMAYALYKKVFHGEPFAALKENGARPQKIVLASTSAKNPDYPDTCYVDELIGPETVNTLPAATLAAYRDHGKPASRLEQNLDESHRVFDTLESLGIDVDQIMDQLLEDGVRLFANSFDELIAGINQKRTRLLRGWGHRSASLGALQKPVDDILAKFDAQAISESIWSGNASIWTEDPNGGIGRRLGWLQSVEVMEGERARLKDFAEEIRSDGIRNVVLLGMGGSSLAAEVFAKCFGVGQGYPDLKILDTTLPASILSLERTLDLEKTLFIVSSKSGGTIEVMSLYEHFKSQVETAGLPVGRHFIAITDPGTVLGKMAAKHAFRRTFLNPPDIGGRFSALSYFGLVPAALIGADLDRLLMRAAQSVEASLPEVPALENPGLWLGAIIGIAATHGVDKLSIVVSPPLEPFGLWLEQLIAESTGKQGKGILPIVGEPLGNPDTYGEDRLFVYLRLDGDCSYDQQISELEKSGRPVVTQRVHTAYDLGREMFRWEFATAVSGVVLGINPFDQPNVQESKEIAKQLLQTNKKEGRLPECELVEIDDPNFLENLHEFLRSVGAGRYVALNAFLDPSEETNGLLQSMRAALRYKYKVATTLGFGPRYLHSIGQIQKGGPAKGHFIQITDEHAEDIMIPGLGYSFGTLKEAQAIGDYEALKKKGKPVIRIHLKKEEDLGRLLEAIRIV